MPQVMKLFLKLLYTLLVFLLCFAELLERRSLLAQANLKMLFFILDKFEQPIHLFDLDLKFICFLEFLNQKIDDEVYIAVY